MAQQKDFFARLADMGEDALSRIADVPGGQRFLEAANGMRDRMDEMQKRLRGLDALEKRVAALERKLAAASKPSGARKPAARKTAARKPAAKKPATTRKTTT